MGKRYDQLLPQQIEWVEQQKIFFVATAPLSADGHVNCSPKGMDSFRVLGPNEVAYLDLTGSGIETIAHLRENGRMVIMFCAFDGAPKIVRLHGVGNVLTAGAKFDSLISKFPTYRGVRAIIHLTLTDISDSCGYSVPRFDYVEERDTLIRWTDSKTDEELARYCKEKNAKSVDGLAGIE